MINAKAKQSDWPIEHPRQWTQQDVLVRAAELPQQRPVSSFVLEQATKRRSDPCRPESVCPSTSVAGRKFAKALRCSAEGRSPPRCESCFDAPGVFDD